MATQFTQDCVLRFLLRNGGNVRNVDLLTHFKEFLREHEEREQNRELFKRYVNTVATVKQDDGVSYVVLKKKYRAHLGDVSNRNSSAAPTGRRAESKQEGAGRTKVTVCTAKPSHGEDHTLNTHTHNTDHILPVAGIVNNRGNQSSAHQPKSNQSSAHQPWEERVSSVPSSKDQDINTYTPGMSSLTVESKYSFGSGQNLDQPSEVKGFEEKANPKHNGVHGAKHGGQLREADDCSQKAFYPPPDYPHYEMSVDPPSEDVSHKEMPESFRSFEENPSFAWPFPIRLRQSQMSASSPCLTDIPTDASHFDAYGQDGLTRSNDSLLRPDYNGRNTDIYIRELEDYGAPVNSAPHQHNPPQTPHPPVDSGYLESECLQGRSSSYNSFLTPSINSEWPQAFPQYSWSSDDALNYRSGVLIEGGMQTQASTHRSHEVNLRHQECQFTPWHNSTGNLLDKPQASLPNSLPDESTRNRPVAQRQSHRLRSRMCRSLGAELDQASKEDSDTARLKRLHLISSFLNVSTHSSLDVSPASSVHSLSHESSSRVQRHLQVPLEPQEHEWFVKAATGIWTDIYSLFREDPSLLTKRDIVSGYTVLHWIAKHGDHRVLNTLYYGVHKAGMALDVNTRSTCGYTPLHLAAIHGHKNLLRLLVHKFKANVYLRDNSGKRPWQYLEKNNDRDLLELLGAPQGMTGGGAGVQWSSDRPPVAPVSARSAATVKRHTSLAALFKHKSQLRVSANAESFF